MIDKIKRYQEERSKWINAGCPTRSKAEMKRIHSVCQECPFFEKGKGLIPGYDRCGICECNLHPTSPRMNKLFWGTTKCPDDPPRWEEMPQEESQEGESDD